MKNLTIYQSSSPVINIDDNDDTKIEDYREKISSLFESNNVVILEVSTGSLIIRPSTISSIFISETIQDELSEKKIEKPIDIITEM